MCYNFSISERLGIVTPLRVNGKFLITIIDMPGIVKNLLSHREIIRILTVRDFKARFRGSVFGFLWPIIQPLLMMILYTLVFSSFLKVKFNASDSPFIFAVYLLCGLLPWNTFSEGLSTSSTLIRTNHNLVKRVVFPLEVLPLNLTLVSIIQQLIGLLLLIPMAVAITGRLTWAILMIPILILFQILFTTGTNWIWSAISVFIPDLKQFTNLVVIMLMFITPIFYPESTIPAWASFIFVLNPMALLIHMYRVTLIDGVFPSVLQVLGTGIACLLFFLVGYAIFMASKKMFSDLL